MCFLLPWSPGKLPCVFSTPIDAGLVPLQLVGIEGNWVPVTIFLLLLKDPTDCIIGLISDDAPWQAWLW